MGSLFGITNEYLGLMSQIEDLGGELTPELAEQLAINESNMATKCRAYFHIINQKNSEIKLAQEEQERLNNIIKSRESVINRLKKTLVDAVEVFGVIEPKAVNKSINLGDLKILHKKSISVEINEGQVVDDERFCLKETKFAMNYIQANILNIMLDKYKTFDLVPITNIKVQKDPLKKWLLENEEEHKKLVIEHKTIPSKFEQLNGNEFEVHPLTENEVKQYNQEVKDVKIILATTIKRNTTVNFK